jgi:REP element-mobilizing transposase RayT
MCDAQAGHAGGQSFDTRTKARSVGLSCPVPHRRAEAPDLTSLFVFYNICRIKMADASRQCALPFRTWGGRRAGAGRKPAGSRAGVPHCPRPVHSSREPVHVTLRAVRGLPSLRSEQIFPTIRRGLSAAAAAAFRVVHFSVQENHVHLLVEADGTHALGRGMQGLAIRLAKAINRRLGRTGRVWSDRYHARALRTPREVRHGLVYVLLNGRKHGVSGPGIDPCSSGRWFDGWRDRIQAPWERPPITSPRTWLLRVGWRRSGLIGIDQAPAAPGRRRRRSARRRSGSA